MYQKTCRIQQYLVCIKTMELTNQRAGDLKPWHLLVYSLRWDKANPIFFGKVYVFTLFFPKCQCNDKCKARRGASVSDVQHYAKMWKSFFFKGFKTNLKYKKYEQKCTGGNQM